MGGALKDDFLRPKKVSVPEHGALIQPFDEDILAIVKIEVLDDRHLGSVHEHVPDDPIQIAMVVIATPQRSPAIDASTKFSYWRRSFDKAALGDSAHLRYGPEWVVNVLDYMPGIDEINLLVGVRKSVASDVEGVRAFDGAG